MLDDNTNFGYKLYSAMGTIGFLAAGGWVLFIKALLKEQEARMDNFGKRIEAVEDDYISRREVEELKISLRDISAKIDRIIERRIGE